MDSALFIGRFQPFHNGHLTVIKKILEHHQHIIIVIGSAQYSHEKHNPFTAQQRTQMIQTALKSEGITPDKFTIIPVKDTHDANWYYLLQSHLPPYSTLYTGSEEVKSHFEAGHSTAKIVHLERIDNLSATKIRQLIKQNKPIDKFVPSPVAELIKKWKTKTHD